MGEGRGPSGWRDGGDGGEKPAAVAVADVEGRWECLGVGSEWGGGVRVLSFPQAASHPLSTQEVAQRAKLWPSYYSC